MTLKPLDIPAGFHKNGTELEESNKWVDGSLVRWLDGSLRPIGGWRERVADVSEHTIRGMHSWQDLTQNAWLATGCAHHLKAITGGGTVYDITPEDYKLGREDAVTGTGYGAGFYGIGYYGVPISQTSDAIPLPATTVDIDNFGEIMISCSVDDGRILEWSLDTSAGPELVTNGTFDADTDWTKGNGGAGKTNWIVGGGTAQYIHYKPVFDAGDTAVVSDGADTITITDHRFGDGDEVVYNVPAAPAYAIGGLTDGATYYIISSTANTFQLSATSGGAAIDLLMPSVTVDANDAAVVDVAADKVIFTNTFANGDYVRYSKGAAPAAAIGGLVDGDSYYIVNASATDFQLSLTSGGAAIDLTAKYNITFDGNDAAVVDAANDKIIQANTFADGDEVLYSNGGGVDIGGLTDGSSYFVINASATEFQLSATSGGAAINLTPNNSVTFDGDDATVVDAATNTIIQANTFVANDLVTYSAGGGIAIDGLTDGGTYYVVNPTASNFQLSLTSGGAAVTLTANYQVTFDGSDVTVVDDTTETFTVANTFTDGDLVTYDNGGGTDIAGLTNGSNYYIVNASATYFQVSATAGGTPIDITAVGTGTSHVFRIDIGSSHEVRADIGSSHNLEQDIQSSHTFTANFGAGHNLDRQNYGNLSQTITGLDNDILVFDASDAAVVDIANDKIIVANTFTSSEVVTYDADGGSAIGGLVDGTNYYIVNATPSSFQVSENAFGAAIELTAVGVGTTHGFKSGKQDAHDIVVTMTDLADADGPATAPDVNIKITGTSSGTVLVDQALVSGKNRIRFATDDDSVELEFIPNAYNTSDFEIDGVTLGHFPVAEIVDNAPINNLGVIVTEERFIFALGADNNSRKIAWCDFEDRDTWVPSTTNQAGSQELQTNGQIMCAVRGRGNTVVITDADAHTATYVGPPYIYQWTRVGTHCGAVSRKSAVSTDRGVFWYGQENFFVFDGNSVQVLPCDVHDYVFNDFNSSQQSKVWGMVNGAHQEIWWFYPSSGSLEVDRYVAYDFMEGHWLIGELSRTSGVSRGVFAYPIMAERDTQSNLYDHEVGHNHDGGSVFAETGPIFIEAGDQIVKVNSVIPDEKTQGQVQMTFKTRFYPNDTERTYGPFDPTSPTSVRFSGRQIRMRVDQDQATDWRVGVMRLETNKGGRR